MANPTIEERLSRVEAQVAELTGQALPREEETQDAPEVPFDEAAFSVLVKEMQEKTARRAPGVSRPVQKRGWRSFVGIYENSPHFDSVIEAGAKWRAEDRTVDAEETT